MTYSTGNREYSIYQESEVNDLIEELQRADLVVGFNTSGLTMRCCTATLRSTSDNSLALDLMVDLQQKLSHRLKLDSIANATFRQKDCRRPAGFEVVQTGQNNGDRRVLLLRRENHQDGA